jgi:hypothetical protein
LFENARCLPRRGVLQARHLRKESELWNEQLLTPLGLGTLIEVDTATEVDLDALVSQIRALVPSSGTASTG